VGKTADAGKRATRGRGGNTVVAVNIVFVEPGFPANQRRFALALA